MTNSSACSGQIIEVASLNAMHQLLWFSFSGNQVKPAPRDHHVWPQSEHAVCNRIAMMMVVEKPGAELTLLERRLNGIEIHASILNRLQKQYRPAVAAGLVLTGRAPSGYRRRYCYRSPDSSQHQRRVLRPKRNAVTHGILDFVLAA